MRDFKCFGRAVLDLQYPGRTPTLEMPNVNLVLGDNGGGKSSVLRAIAIAALAPALLRSGFVPYRLVRRPNGKQATLNLVCELDPMDLIKGRKVDETIDLMARIDRSAHGSNDLLYPSKIPHSAIERLIFDDRSHAFFVVGYGATRRTETDDYVESSSRKSRGIRYQRVAGLFEDHVPLRPMQSWLFKTKNKQRRREAIEKLSSVLPEQITFSGNYNEAESQFVFDFAGRSTPFSALSDGYKAFIGWTGDLIGHLCDVAPDGVAIDKLSGIVLIDEIDLHLHPAWQLSVVPLLAAAFPKLQFVMSSHSPLIANTLRKENLFVTDVDDDGTATVKQIGESVHGRGTDQLLLSSYFGLESTMPPELQNKSRTLFSRAAGGDAEAAIAFVKQLGAPPSAPEILPEVQTLSRASPRKVRKTPIFSKAASAKGKKQKSKAKKSKK